MSETQVQTMVTTVSGQAAAVGVDRLRASVVLPVLNARSQIEGLLDRLRGQDFPRDAWELVIVDNGSTDGTWEWIREIREPWIHVVRESKRGPSAARNCGVRHARAGIVVFIDSDCVPQRNWLSQMVSVFDNRAIWAAGGIVVSAPPESLTEAFTAKQKLLNQEDFFKPMRYKPPFLLTANFAARRAVFARVGGFDESLLVGEDADFCWRLLQAGGRLHLTPEAIVEHRHRSSPLRFARQMYNYGIGSVAVFSKHRDFIAQSYWLDGRSYFCLGKAIVKALLYPVVRRDPYMRYEGALEVVRFSCFLFGRLIGSLKYRILVI